MKTPVAFFVFNRPDLTRMVFETIRAARPERLLVVADGPRVNRPNESKLCAEVRAVVETVDWPCQVHRNYADSNMGCKMRVSSGLDWVFSQVEEAIILEDDCLPHPDFFRFCEEMLERYRKDDRIKMVQGSNFLPDASTGGSYFFSKYFAIWGWATWRRAWEGYDVKLNDWPERKKRLAGKDWFYNGAASRHLESLFDKAANQEIDTWDYQWLCHCVMRDGLSIVPRTNLISNVGDEGVHISVSQDGPNPYLHKESRGIGFPLVHPTDAMADRGYDLALMRMLAPGIVGRVKRRMKRMFKGA